MKKLLIGLLALGSISSYASTIEGIYTGECKSLITKTTNNVAIKLLSDADTGDMNALLGVNYSKQPNYMNALSKNEVDFELTFKNVGKATGEVTKLSHNQFKVELEPHPSLSKKKNVLIFSIDGDSLKGVSDPKFEYECELVKRD